MNPLDPTRIGGAGGGAITSGASTGRTSPGFAAAFEAALERLDEPARAADRSLADLVDGKAESPHESMIRLEEAHLTLLWTVQVRNRVLDAYNEIMRTPL